MDLNFFLNALQLLLLDISYFHNFAGEYFGVLLFDLRLQLSSANLPILPLAQMLVQKDQVLLHASNRLLLGLAKSF
jgi:hypothetical protein